ncbi:MAG: hypothetical protein CM1200mP16_10040 [Nitrospina sp.]|nr:MAG: hypothetical protein CM1200mP16_10040 [Nitrospina sp.]
MFYIQTTARCYIAHLLICISNLGIILRLLWFSNNIPHCHTGDSEYKDPEILIACVDEIYAKLSLSMWKDQFLPFGFLY